MRQLGWIVGGIVTVLAVVFAVHNYSKQTVNLWPLPYNIELPLYALVLFAVALGFVIGSFLTWVSESRWRRLARKRGRRLSQLEKQVGAVEPAAENARSPATLPATTTPSGNAVLPPGSGS